MSLADTIGIERWDIIQRTKKTMPYLRLVCITDNTAPEKCRLLNGIIRHVDDGFWSGAFPSDCYVTVQQLAERDLVRQGIAITKDEDLPSWEKIV